jgi:hypothetical protein
MRESRLRDTGYGERSMPAAWWQEHGPADVGGAREVPQSELETWFLQPESYELALNHFLAWWHSESPARWSRTSRSHRRGSARSRCSLRKDLVEYLVEGACLLSLLQPRQHETAIARKTHGLPCASLPLVYVRGSSILALHGVRPAQPHETAIARKTHGLLCASVPLLYARASSIPALHGVRPNF